MEKTRENEVFDSLDRETPNRVLLDQEIAILTKSISEETDKKQKRRDKAKFNRLLGKRKTMISDEFWEKFILYSKACYLHNEESDLYDVFDTIRTHSLGGWQFTQKELDKIDAQILKEEERNARLGNTG